MLPLSQLAEAEHFGVPAALKTGYKIIEITPGFSTDRLSVRITFLLEK